MTVKHRPRKRFGQHFLTNGMIIQQIIDAIHIYPSFNNNLVEIGPGTGALTWPLLRSTEALTAIEFDRDLIKMLNHSASREAPGKTFTLYQADVLQFDFMALAQKINASRLRLVGNLPYNISTPLLFHLLEQREVIEDMYFMLQEEVADRLAALPNTKAYGRLSIMLQCGFHMEKLFTVPPEAFNPPPKVNSAVVRFLPHEESYIKNIQDFDLFSDVVREAFQHRRKTLRKALANFLNHFIIAKNMNKKPEEIIIAADINPACRAAELSVQHYIQLANVLFVLGQDKR